jgi:hypothetical protein
MGDSRELWGGRGLRGRRGLTLVIVQEVAVVAGEAPPRVALVRGCPAQHVVRARAHLRAPAGVRYFMRR